MLIDRIFLRQGAGPGAPRLHFSPGRITVLVGPNNSGKSLLLREIEQQLRGSSDRPGLVLDHMWVIPAPENAILLSGVEGVEVAPLEGKTAQGGEAERIVGTELAFVGEKKEVHLASRTLDRLDRTGRPPESVSNTLTTERGVVRLTGRERFGQVRPTDRGNQFDPPQTMLQKIFRSQERKARLRMEVEKAFPGVHLIIDSLRGANLVLGTNPESPGDDALAAHKLEVGQDQDAKDYHSKTTPLQESSDGVNAFVGLVAPLLSEDYAVMLIDEPEAFLSGPRQRQLGRLLVDLAEKRSGHVIVSTHSPQFLMGAIEEAVEDLQIIRLTYDSAENLGTARWLSDDSLRALSFRPQLRSAGALEAAFRDGVVVVESPYDEAFYREVSRRLTSRGDSPGLIPDPDLLFIPAHGKAALPVIAAPLRSLGIPAVMLGDLDVLAPQRDWPKKPSKQHPDGPHHAFKAIVRAAGVPDDEVDDWLDRATAVFNEFEKVADKKTREAKSRKEGDGTSVWKLLKMGGVTELSGEGAAVAKELLADLAKQGVFLVPLGELERWDTNVIYKYKQDWLLGVFQRMGDDPGAVGYDTGPAHVDPSLDDSAADVWSFVAQIKEWIVNWPQYATVSSVDMPPVNRRIRSAFEEYIESKINAVISRSLQHVSFAEELLERYDMAYQALQSGEGSAGAVDLGGTISMITDQFRAPGDRDEDVAVIWGLRNGYGGQIDDINMRFSSVVDGILARATKGLFRTEKLVNQAERGLVHARPVQGESLVFGWEPPDSV